ncbi:hypothetical protein [Streptomyces sp. NPDC051452]|uniref:hypothetical protein n=1 Tax=Streptomyces sp. NPDC051452 TaxID=3365654 RepID=UPI0037A766F5
MIASRTKNRAVVRRSKRRSRSRCRTGRMGMVMLVCLPDTDDEDHLPYECPRSSRVVASGGSRGRTGGRRTRGAAVSVAVGVRRGTDIGRLDTALSRLAEAYPSLVVRPDAETGQSRAVGMGELGPEVAGERIRRDGGPDAAMRLPRGAYRETVAGPMPARQSPRSPARCLPVRAPARRPSSGQPPLHRRAPRG